MPTPNSVIALPGKTPLRRQSSRDSRCNRGTKTRSARACAWSVGLDQFFVVQAGLVQGLDLTLEHGADLVPEVQALVRQADPDRTTVVGRPLLAEIAVLDHLLDVIGAPRPLLCRLAEQRPGGQEYRASSIPSHRRERCDGHATALRPRRTLHGTAETLQQELKEAQWESGPGLTVRRCTEPQA